MRQRGFNVRQVLIFLFRFSNALCVVTNGASSLDGRSQPRPALITSLSFPSLQPHHNHNSAGAKAAFLSSLAASAALGLANHFSPSFKAALGPSGRAAMVALPALGVVFLEVEWKINACAMRQRYADKPTAVEPNDILPKRSG